MSIQHGGYRRIPAPGEQTPTRKRSRPKKHGRGQYHAKTTPQPQGTAELAAAFARAIRQLNGALDGRHRPVDQQRVRSLEGQLDRIVRDWEAAETT